MAEQETREVPLLVRCTENVEGQRSHKYTFESAKAGWLGANATLVVGASKEGNFGFPPPASEDVIRYVWNQRDEIRVDRLYLVSLVQVPDDFDLTKPSALSQAWVRTEKVDLERLREAVGYLHGLLQANEQGLATWCEMMGDRIKELWEVLAVPVQKGT